MEDIDKNGDGLIDLEEYIGKLFLDLIEVTLGKSMGFT